MLSFAIIVLFLIIAFKPGLAIELDVEGGKTYNITKKMIRKRNGLARSCWSRWTKGKKRPPSIATQIRDEIKAMNLSCSEVSHAVGQRFSKFVILSNQHSGTTWFSKSISRHPDFLGVTHEILLRFTRGGAQLSDWSWQSAYYAMNSLNCDYCAHQSTLECLNSSQVRSGTFSGGAAGFGIQGNQGWEIEGQLEAILPIWKESGVRVIVLERRNTLAHVFASSGVKSLENEEDEEPLIVLDNNFIHRLNDTFIQNKEKYRRMRELVNNFEVPMHSLSYESLVSNPAVELGKVFRFILNDKRTTSRWRIETSLDGTKVLFDRLYKDWNLTVSNEGRHHVRPLRDRVKNYNQSLQSLSAMFPEGVCMLEENCVWF